MGRWFRFYEDTLDNPKVQMLSDANYRLWTGLLCIASRNRGKIPGDMGVLSFALRKATGKCRDVVQVLLSANLLEVFEDGYRPKDWDQWQYKSDVSTDRVKQFRKRQRNVSGNENETPPDNRVQNTETESEKENKPRAQAQRVKMPDGWPSQHDKENAVEYWKKQGREDLVPHLEREVTKARAHHLGKGTRSPDWAQVWVTWYTNAVQYNRAPPQSSGQDKPAWKPIKVA